MKKSEMLGKIWTLLYLETDLNEESLKDLSLMILKELEDNKMQPPPNQTGTFDNSWEEE